MLSLCLVIFSMFMILGFDPVSAQRLHAANLVYEGAFAYPAGDDWTYSGHALAFYPPGDPGGAGDGYSGSLFAVGHAWDQRVGEISIPAPVMASRFEDLPHATVLRPLTDITEGWIDNCTYTPDCMYREIGGLEYVADIDRIIWNLRDWYNVAGYDQDSLGWSRPDFSDPHGVWHIGSRSDPNAHNARTCNYLFQAPVSIASAHLNNRRLIAGNHRQAGAFGGSQGPTLYATAPWQDGSPPASGQDLGATALLYYPEDYDCTGNVFDACYFPGYRVDDDWGGGAWIPNGTESTVLIFGIKGLGDNCYGIPGEDCPENPCSDSKGWHSPPYEPQILFYDGAELLDAAAGNRDPWAVYPYEIARPAIHMFNPECASLNAVAYDEANQRLYVTERQAGPWGETAVHVWSVDAAASPDPIPDVKVNGLDGSVTVAPHDLLDITVGLEAGGMAGQSADWWLLIGTPFCWCYLDPQTSWTPGLDVTWQGPIGSFSPLTILALTGLPPGGYFFCFGIDMTVDGSISSNLYFDYVEVNIVEN